MQFHKGCQASVLGQFNYWLSRAQLMDAVLTSGVLLIYNQKKEISSGKGETHMKKTWYKIWKERGKMKKNIFWYFKEEQEYQKQLERIQNGFMDIKNHFRNQ